MQAKAGSSCPANAAASGRLHCLYFHRLQIFNLFECQRTEGTKGNSLRLLFHSQTSATVFAFLVHGVSRQKPIHDHQYLVFLYSKILQLTSHSACVLSRVTPSVGYPVTAAVLATLMTFKITTQILTTCLFTIRATAIWPIPLDYTHGSTFLWLSPNAVFSYQPDSGVNLVRLPYQPSARLLNLSFPDR